MMYVHCGIAPLHVWSTQKMSSIESPIQHNSCCTELEYLRSLTDVITLTLPACCRTDSNNFFLYKLSSAIPKKVAGTTAARGAAEPATENESATAPCQLLQSAFCSRACHAQLYCASHELSAAALLETAERSR